MKNTVSIIIFLILILQSISSRSQQLIQDKTLSGNVVSNKEALLELSSPAKGLLNARIALQKTTLTDPFENHIPGMLIYNTAMVNDVIPGLYYNNGKKWILAGAGTVSNISFDPETTSLSFLDENNVPRKISLKKNETLTKLVENMDGTYSFTAEDGKTTVINQSGALPRFFYMPSIMIPALASQFVKEAEGESFGTINLYERYIKQFTRPMAASSNAPALPVVGRDRLYYYITWYDSAVFTNVTVDSGGMLRYSIVTDAEPVAGSFMNIVFALK